MSNSPKNDNIKRTTITTRIIWLLLGLFFIITVISQVYIYFYNPLRLETAQMYSSTDSILFSGIYARNERTVSYNGAGIVAYTHINGSKIARNSVVAQSYSSIRDISLQRQIDIYNEQINILKDAQALDNTDNSQLESFNNQINNKHSQMISMLNSSDYSGIADLKNSMLSLQCKKMIVRGSASDYSVKIAELENKIFNLKAQINSLPLDISVMDESGYFVSSVDGYEKKITYDNVLKFTKSEIEDIIKKPVIDTSESTIGKIIDDYKWRLVGILDTERTRSIFEGSVVEMRVGASASTIKATVYSVKRLDDGTSIFIFECDRLSVDFVDRRVSQFRLFLDTNKGIRISSSAITFIDGQIGVYIKSGDEIVFKKINVIISSEDYVLVEDTTDLDGYISLYDNVVISQLDLYEGKIVL